MNPFLHENETSKPVGGLFDGIYMLQVYKDRGKTTFSRPCGGEQFTGPPLPFGCSLKNLFPVDKDAAVLRFSDGSAQCFLLADSISFFCMTADLHNTER